MAAQAQSAPGSHIQGWMNAHELRWLFETAKRMQSVVEIGCWKGRSTFALCFSGCPAVYAVDHFNGTQIAWMQERIHREGSTENEFLRNLAGFDNLHVVRADSETAASLVPDADMVFIDGSHDYDSVVQDIELWKPKTKRLLCGHDFSDEFPGVLQAVMEKCDGFRVLETIWHLEVR